MGLGPRTVRARTAIAAALVVAAALSITGALVVHTLHGRLVRGQRDTAELRARDIAALASDGRLPATLSIPGEDRALIQIVDGQNRVVAQSVNTTGEPSILLTTELRNVPQAKTMRGLPIGDGERFVVVTQRATTPAGALTVVAAESLESADEDSAAVARLLFFGFPLVVCLVTLIVLRTTTSAFAPVSTMTRQLGEISSNDLHRQSVPRRFAGRASRPIG